jgi:signal transduction histidine kinase
MGAAGELSERQSHFLEIVKSNTERLTVLVNDLLDISRIESGRETLALQPLDAGEAARSAAERLERRAQQENKPMRVRVKTPRGLPPVNADPERLALILDNLLENAYNYTEAGGDITLSLHPRRAEVQIDVQDSGIGIPLDLQSRVFDRFYRGEHPFVLATSGTGLGLSIVKHLVEMHNGRIWLESSGAPGQGSTFSFTLPIRVSEPDPTAEAMLP